MNSIRKRNIDLVSESTMDSASKEDVKPDLSTPVHLENWRTAGLGLDIGETDHMIFATMFRFEFCNGIYISINSLGFFPMKTTLQSSSNGSRFSF